MEDIDIESLLGGSKPTVAPAEPQKKAIGEDIDVLYRMTSSWAQGCRDLSIDLRNVRFVSDEGGMWLELPEGSVTKKIDFKRDPANPKDPKIVHAQKQFCKMLGVPHGFFVSNRPMMRESIVRTWQSGLETDDKRSKCTARIRDGSSVQMIRALVPSRAVPPKANDIVNSIIGAFGKSVRVLFSHGDDKDALMLHARFLFEDKVPVDAPELRMGFDLVMSELGACSMTVDAIVYDQQNDVSYVASYGGEPFFSSKYDGLQSQELSTMFPGLLSRIRSEAGAFAAAFVSARDGVYSVKQDCVQITRGKGFTTAMRSAVFHEVTQATDVVTKLDVARHVSMVARDFDSLKGLVLERAAGYYINLCFARSEEEPQGENVDGIQTGSTAEAV